MTAKIKMFFEINENEDTRLYFQASFYSLLLENKDATYQNLWDTFKAVCEGNL